MDENEENGLSEKDKKDANLAIVIQK